MTRNVAVPVSAGLLGDIDGYFAALTRYREGHPDRIIATVGEAVFSAINNGRALVREIQSTSARHGTSQCHCAIGLVGAPARGVPAAATPS